MGEIVNLRRLRKHRDKRAREETAQANRAAFGRTKAERNLTETEAKLERERHEAHRLEPAPKDEE